MSVSTLPHVLPTTSAVHTSSARSTAGRTVGRAAARRVTAVRPVVDLVDTTPVARALTSVESPVAVEDLAVTEALTGVEALTDVEALTGVDGLAAVVSPALRGGTAALTLVRPDDDRTPPDGAAAELEHEAPRWSDTRVLHLFSVLRTAPAEHQRTAARDALVTLHSAFATSLARRFARRGEPLDDLRQVAFLGLLKAIDRFDPEQGASFAAFAVPTIVGELRRHFRDTGWHVHVPRALQERRAAVSAATERLIESTGRPPTRHELAAELGLTELEVAEGQRAARAYRAESLDLPSSADDDTPRGARLGLEDHGYERIELNDRLQRAMRALEPRERRLLGLRFFHEMTQTQIADELGISQVHVSRLLTRTLGTLRERLDAA